MAYIMDSDSIMTPDSPVLVTSTVSPGWVSVSNDTFIRSPVVSSINLTYSKPQIGTFESFNFKPEVHKRLTKYFYYRLLDKWLFEDITDVLNYLVVKGDKVSVINSLSEYKPSNIKKDTDDTVKMKSDFIQNNVFSKRDMLNFLTKFVYKTETNWVDLPKNEAWLYEILERDLIKKIKKMIPN